MGEEKMNEKKWVLMMGRYQPLHAGHIKLIRTVLDKGNNVQIGLRRADGGDKNPYDYIARIDMIRKEFTKEMRHGRVKIVELEDITEIAYGRKVGYSFNQIQLDDETEQISGTKVRKQMKENK